MQDNENLSETEPTATDETAGGGPESTTPCLLYTSPSPRD